MTLLIVASFRDIAKEWKVITSLLPLLSFHEISDMRVQAMRAVGNLCIDHGKRLVILYYYPMHACAARGKAISLVIVYCQHENT